MNKTYTFKGRQVRLYSDGSDTDMHRIHCAVQRILDGKWFVLECKESDLVEVWIPQKGDICYFWTDTGSLTVTKFDRIILHACKYVAEDGGWFQYCAPFKGKLPPDFKGLEK